MKRAVILHAMEQNSQGHWYPWLKAELEKRGYEVFVPNLPSPKLPSTEEMTAYLLDQTDWDFSDNLVIGHSSGAVEVLYLLQALGPRVKINCGVLVGSFEKPVTGMEAQHAKMFNTPLNFQEAKLHATRLLFVHGDDDPWCPLEGAKHLAELTDAELVVVPRGKHFSTSLDPAYTEFPKLLQILEERDLV